MFRFVTWLIVIKLIKELVKTIKLKNWYQYLVAFWASLDGA
jgi:hypothetical protein